MTRRLVLLSTPGGRLSLRFSRLGLLLIAGLVACAIGLALVAIMLGDLNLTPAQVLHILVGGEAERGASFLVAGLRLPRALCALLAGLGLGIAGAIFQRIFRNPLASPDVLGITTGASLGGASLIWLGLPPWLVSASSAGAGVVTAVLILALAYRGVRSVGTMIIVGIGLTAAMHAILAYLLRVADLGVAERVMHFTIGSLGYAAWPEVLVAGLALVLLVPPLLALDRHLGLIELGDDIAIGLGVPRDGSGLVLLALAALLAGAMVAVCGPVGFVALIAPHAARALVGSNGGTTTIVAGLLGALLLLVSDMVGQHAFSAALPAGAITAAVGAPYFLVIFYVGARRGLL